MARSLNLLAAATLLAGAAGALAQPQRPPEATPRAAAAGAAACRGLPDDPDTAASRLIELGWERATTTNAAPDAAPLPIFGRDRAILFLAPPEASEGRGTGCMVVATLARSVRWRNCSPRRRPLWASRPSLPAPKARRAGGWTGAISSCSCTRPAATPAPPSSSRPSEARNEHRHARPLLAAQSAPAATLASADAEILAQPSASAAKRRRRGPADRMERLSAGAPAAQPYGHEACAARGGGRTVYVARTSGPGRDSIAAAEGRCGVASGARTSIGSPGARPAAQGPPAEMSMLGHKVSSSSRRRASLSVNEEEQGDHRPGHNVSSDKG